MQYGNRYSVHTSSYGWCTEWGEFKTLEEANECFYNKIRDEVEEKNADHQRRFFVYMLEWSKDLNYRKEIRCWSVEEGYTMDFPRKPKSIFKILKQLYIKHKVETRRRKEKYIKESIKDMIDCDICDTYCNSELKKAKVEIDYYKQRITELEEERDKYKARCEHYERCIMQMREEKE